MAQSEEESVSGMQRRMNRRNGLEGAECEERRGGWVCGERGPDGALDV